MKPFCKGIKQLGLEISFLLCASTPLRSFQKIQYSEHQNHVLEASNVKLLHHHCKCQKQYQTNSIKHDKHNHTNDEKKHILQDFHKPRVIRLKKSPYFFCDIFECCFQNPLAIKPFPSTIINRVNSLSTQ